MMTVMQKVGFIATGSSFMLTGLVCYLIGCVRDNDILIFMGLWFPLGLLHLTVVLVYLRKIARAERERDDAKQEECHANG